MTTAPTIERTARSGWCLTDDCQGCKRHPKAVALCHCHCHRKDQP